MGPSVIDIRVSIVTQVRKQCYVKLRPIADRFSNENAKAWLAPTDIFLDSSEIALVNEFCQRIKLDFGQLDLCRDNISNRLYIVDANNTPFGPANGMAKDDSIAAITELAVDFVSEFGLNAVGLN
jgi:hypothetical protein